jgi:hypothetical protein
MYGVRTLEWDLGPVAGVERRFMARDCVPLSGGPRGVGLSRTAGVTDAHSWKSADEEKMGEGRAG